jgi:hypothetical protein
MEFLVGFLSGVIASAVLLVILAVSLRKRDRV